jgi:beta-galactosidase
MNLSSALAVIFLSLVDLASAATPPDNETMFPPAPEAKASIDFDGKGFIVNGQRTYVSSGSIHYPRVPRELWHDRLLRLKRAGFNTLQTYTFWNFHEPTEGQFDFTGQHDFEEYLKEAQDVGLYATVRVGPYVCSEWDSGGYPVWLKFKPDLVVRENNPAYVAAQDAWLNELLPKVAAHQINRGGNVILVQLENEGKIQGAWTRPVSGDAYFDHLHDVGIKGGLQVPFFMSGYHHGSVPIVENPDNTGRQCPWISTEIWAGWYLNYGWSDYGFSRIYRCNEYIMARGGNGQNYYPFMGGTNFDTWNDNENAASYDFSASMGETGDLRPVYFAEKANNLFATSFADILENSSYAKPDYTDYAKNGDVIGARKSPSGTVVFVEGLAGNTDPALIKSVATGNDVAIHIPALMMCPIVLDYPLVPAAKITLVQGITTILGTAHNGNTTTLVVYGQPGDTNELTLSIDGAKKTVPLTYSATMPVEIIEKAGDQTLRILAMSRQLSDRTWIVGKPKEEYVVVGPEYCGDFSMQGGKPSMTIERPYSHPAPNQVVVYGPAETPAQHLAVTSDASLDTAPAPTLSAWQASPLTDPKSFFNSDSWKTSDDPRPMGADGDISAFAWYRTTVEVPHLAPPGTGILHFHGAADHLIVFLNGRLLEAKTTTEMPKPHSDELRDGKLEWTAISNFNSGKNTLVVLATHQGRDKAGGYWGPIDQYYEKGIFKPVDLEIAGQTIPVKGWKLHGGLPDPASLPFFSEGEGFTGSPSFYRTTFTATPPTTGANPILRFDTSSLSRGTVFLNGYCLGRYPSTLKDHDKPVGLYLPECWFAPNGKNTLLVFDEEGKNPFGAKIYVEVAASREVIAVSQPADASLAFQLPPYDPVDMRKGAQVNAATDRPVTASSFATDNEPSYITMGDDLNMWKPAEPPTADKPAWLQIDLQQPHTLLSSEIFWSADAKFYPYRIQGSADGKTWKTLVDKSKPDDNRGDGNRTFDKIADGTGLHYLRLTISPGTDAKKPLGIREWRAWDVVHF